MARTYTACVEVAIVEVLRDVTDTELTEECRSRGLLPKDTKPSPASQERQEQARYEFDTLIHDLRAAFMARDQRHMDVLLIRLEARHSVPA